MEKAPNFEVRCNGLDNGCFLFEKLSDLKWGTVTQKRIRYPGDEVDQSGARNDDKSETMTNGKFILFLNDIPSEKQI